MQLQGILLKGKYWLCNQQQAKIIRTKYQDYRSEAQVQPS